jgi:hypothetical protein
MPSIDPIYIGAIAALTGVMLTVGSQIAIQRLQRRHDRTSKLFETKLSLYSDFSEALHGVQQVRESIDQAELELADIGARQGKIRAAIAHRRTERESITQPLEAFNAKYGLPGGGYPDNLPEDVRAEANRLLDAYKEWHSREDLRKTESSSRQEQLKELRRELDEARRRQKRSQKRLKSATKTITTLGTRLALVAEEQVGHELTSIVQRLEITGKVDPKDLVRFGNAARAELGVPRQRLQGSINSVRRSYRAMRLRAKQKKDEQE